MAKLYQIQEFAALTGVTVKALHHYDSLGLLKPQRTAAGYRLYAERDMERLEQIVALKFLGLPLKQIKIVLERAALELPDALRMQRKALAEKQEMLARAMRAIMDAEKTMENGKPADLAILKRLIEVIGMQNDIDAMKQYYSEEAWVKVRQRYAAATSYLDHQFAPSDVLLFGRESAGVPPEVHQAADARLVIPMRPGLRSLNVAVAAAMAAGEALRQTSGIDVNESGRRAYASTTPGLPFSTAKVFSVAMSALGSWASDTTCRRTCMRARSRSTLT